MYSRNIVLVITFVTALVLLGLILVNVVRFESKNYLEAKSADQEYIPATSNHLSLAVSNNAIYILTSEQTRWGNYEIFFRKSTDGGNDGFTNPVSLSSNIGQSISPYIFATANNLYVVYSSNTTGNYEIFFQKSTDGGNTFNKAVNLSNDTGLSDFPEISVSGNSVYVVWVDKTPGNYEIFFRKSTDGGNNFGKVIDLSTGVGILSDFPEISASGNSVYVVWVDRVRDYMVRVVSGVGNDEIFFRKSTDGGNTFNKAVNLSNNTEISTNPQLAIDGPNVYVAWYDKNNSSNTNKIVFLKSVDGGIEFGKIINLSNTSEFSYQPDLAACGGSVYAVWSSQVGTRNFDIFLTKSTNKGSLFNKTIDISNGTGFFISPKISVPPSTCNAYVAWFNYNRGPSQIYLAEIGYGVIKQVSLK